MPPPGHYYQKQLASGSAVIAWSHRARFETARRLIGSGRIRKLLDYGCGDGTFLASVAGQVEEGCGADIAADQIVDCAARLAELTNLRFRHVEELDGPEHERAYDVVTCLETLEHCTDRVVERVLADLNRLCALGGRIVISVPIETGLPFLLKYTIRTLAGWRGVGEYRQYERYPLRDAVRMLGAQSGTVIPRPVYGPAGGEFHSHYGFNWRRLRERVRAVLRLDAMHFSPLGWLGGMASSQAWFVCRPSVKEASC
jgi:SAM-dependent methyltransferase